MAEIMTKCPVTNHAISTGVEVGSDADFNSLLEVLYHVHCPLCGGNHVWCKHDAWIAGRSDNSSVGSCAETQLGPTPRDGRVSKAGSY